MKKIASPCFRAFGKPAGLEQSGHLRTKAVCPRHAVIFHAGARAHDRAWCCVVPCTLKIWISGAVKASLAAYAGQAFAETYALCGDVMMVDAVGRRGMRSAVREHFRLFRRAHPARCTEKLLRRLLAVSMRKNLSLSQRIFCTTPKTVRGRLLTYFFRTGRPQRQSAVRDPIQPAAAGRLPACGPQRPLQRAVQNAGRRFAGI